MGMSINWGNILPWIKNNKTEIDGVKFGRINKVVGTVGIDDGNTTNTGIGNIAIGREAGLSRTSGVYSVALGYSAQRSLTTGSYNQAMGYAAQYALTTGSHNQAMGYAAQRSLTTGSYNLCLGMYSGYELTTPNNNTFVGYNSGRGIVTGASNTIIGANVTGLSAGLTKNIILAAGDGTAIPVFANNAAAKAAGLVARALYCTQDAAGERIVKVVW